MKARTFKKKLSTLDNQIAVLFRRATCDAHDARWLDWPSHFTVTTSIAGDVVFYTASAWLFHIDRLLPHAPAGFDIGTWRLHRTMRVRHIGVHERRRQSRRLRRCNATNR